MLSTINSVLTKTSSKLCYSVLRSSSSRTSLFGLGQAALINRTMSTGIGFESAQEKLKLLKNDPGNQTKLKMYALFKQATEGPVTKKRPGALDFVGRAKWDAWKAVESVSEAEAKQKYVDIVMDLLAGEGITEDGGAETGTAATAAPGSYNTLKITMDGGLRIVTFNRPDKKNALTIEMYEEIENCLDEAANDPNTVLTVTTGAGDFYCSGNDLTNLMKVDPANIAEEAQKGGEILRKYVEAYIKFPKPLVAVVNGPAVGVAVSVLGLYDMVYASDKATFHMPFSQLGQGPEACSTFTFPRMMGTSKATEMLLFNRKISAAEAQRRNLVSDVFPQHSLEQEVWPRLKSFSQLPKGSLFYSKQLVRKQYADTLYKVNQEECNHLVERWQSEECMNAVMKFFESKARM